MANVSVTRPEDHQDRVQPIGWLRSELTRNSLLYGVLGLFLVYTVGLSIALGDTLLPFIGYYLDAARRAIFILASVFVTLVAIRSLIQKEHASPFAYMRATLFSPAARRLGARFLFGCLVLAVFMGAFLFNKARIPVIAPFSWDPTFAAWDRILFGGVHPWALLHPILGHAPVTVALDYLYSGWVPLVFLFWAGLMAAPGVSEGLRRQYWLATMVSWILVGLVMATGLSSAGPCFVPFLFPELAADYAGLNAYLGDLGGRILLASDGSKAYLWAIHAGGADLPGGISAMPSMHNAQAALFAAAAYRINRRFGHLMTLYAIVIFIGSIHLGWHYAVDGIVGVIAALAIWVACRRYARMPANETV